MAHWMRCSKIQKQLDPVVKQSHWIFYALFSIMTLGFSWMFFAAGGRSIYAHGSDHNALKSVWLFLAAFILLFVYLGVTIWLGRSWFAANLRSGKTKPREGQISRKRDASP